jgi:hypothetical protein
MKVAKEMFAEKVGELCKLILDLEEDDQADAALYACVQVVTSGSGTYYEGLGIFQEAMCEWRQACIDMTEEENVGEEDVTIH